MASNHGVVYLGPGKVEVQSIDFPNLALGTRKCEHGVILKIVCTNICGSDQHMVRGPHHCAAGPGPRPRDHRRSDRSGPRRGVHQGRGSGLGSLQHRLRALPELQRARDTGICLNVNPARPGRRLRLRGHGRLGGRPGRIRDGAVCGFQSAEIPRQGAGHGEDQGPDSAFPIFCPRATTARSARAWVPAPSCMLPARARLDWRCAAACHLLGAAVVIVGDLIPSALRRQRASDAKR